MTEGEGARPRRDALKIGVALFAIGIVVACGGGSTTPACNNGDTRQCVGAGGCSGGQSCAGGAWSACDCGGTNDGGTDGSSTTDGASPDGGPDITTYLKNCPQVAGTAPMVEIPKQGGGSFCIDVRKVTAAELDAQRGGKPLLTNGWSTTCNQDPTNPSYCAPVDRTKGDMPANCVGWCDAEASCKLFGKRLCTDAEFGAACFVDSVDFPWGLPRPEMAGRCFAPIGPASKSTCRPDAPPRFFVVDLATYALEYLSVPGQKTDTGDYPNGVCGRRVQTSQYKVESNLTYRCCANTK